MFNLITLDCGSVLESELYPTRERCVVRLSDWCRDNWHDDDECPDDFDSRQEMIDWFFENWEDYSWSISEIKMPEMPVGEDILLTPAMCRIVREALGNFQYNYAQIILSEEGEAEVGDSGEAEAMLEQLVHKFE